MKRLLIVLLIALISVGCSNKNSQQSSQATPESSQTSEKNLTIEDVEGYWECKSGPQTSSARQAFLPTLPLGKYHRARDWSLQSPPCPYLLSNVWHLCHDLLPLLLLS